MTTATLPPSLKLRQKVRFAVNGRTFSGVVENRYIDIRGDHNGAPFEAMGLDEEDKNKFASFVYGCPVQGGGWPEPTKNPLRSVTKLYNIIRDEKKRKAALAAWRDKLAHVDEEMKTGPIKNRLDAFFTKHISHFSGYRKEVIKLAEVLSSVRDTRKTKLDAFFSKYPRAFGCQREYVKELADILIDA